MGQEPGTGSETVTAAKKPEQIEREIEQTREQLGDTVAALAQKTDVKSQAQRKLEDTKASARENPLPIAGLGALAVGFVVWRIKRRR